MTPRRKSTSPFREWRRKQAYNLLPLLSNVASALVRGVGATLKTRITGHLPVLEMVESGKPFILVFFHGRLFILIYYLLNWPIVIMLSISYLGELQTRILNNFGYATIRGSRSRGGHRALAGMVGVVKSGKIGVFAVDGPRGPYREVKPGAVFVAKKLGVPIVPVVFRNTLDALPKHALVVRPATIEAVVLPPVETTGWTPEGLDVEIKWDTLRAQMEAAFEKTEDNRFL